MEDEEEIVMEHLHLNHHNSYVIFPPLTDKLNDPREQVKTFRFYNFACSLNLTYSKISWENS
jgi:hypothetical protein